MFTFNHEEKKEMNETEQKMLEMALYDDDGSSADIDEDVEQETNRRKRTPSNKNPSSTQKKRKVIPRASVAEGTLSYSRALTTKHPEVGKSLIASEIMTAGELSAIPEFKQNKAILDARQVQTAFGVDAQKLHEHPQFQKRFPRIHLNFLRCPGSYTNGRTQSTLRNFFSSVGDHHIQEKGDKVYVTIPKRSEKQREQFMQVAQYELYDAVIAAGYKLFRKRRFDTQRYPEYKHHQTGSSQEVGEVERYGGREFVFRKVAVSTTEKRELQASYPPTPFYDRNGRHTGNLVPEIATADESTDYYEEVDLEVLSKQLGNKSIVVNVTDEFVKDGHIKEVASLLEEISHSNEISHYWDIDGGFEAMALLGNGFNMKHAHYFMTRIKKDSSWRAGPAADALLKLAEKVTRGPAIQAMIMVLITLAEEKYSGYDNLMSKITTILSKPVIDSNIGLLLKKELESPIEMDSNVNTLAEFESAIIARNKICFGLLEFAHRKGIAMTFNDASASIQLSNGVNVHIGSTKDYHTIKTFVTSLRQDMANPQPDSIIKVKLAASAIPEDKLHLMIYTALQNKNKVEGVVQFALENQIITKETLANLFHRLIQSSEGIGGYWDVDGGFDAMAMLGDYFSIEHANYFIKKLHSDNWQWLRATKKAMLHLSKTTQDPKSRIAILTVVVALKDSEEFNEFFNQVKKNMGAEIFNQHLALLIKNEFESPVKIPAEYKDFSELEEAITAKNNKFFSLLKFAFSKGIPIRCDDASNTIQLNDGITFHTESASDYQTIKIFILSLKQGEMDHTSESLIKVGSAISSIPEQKLHEMIYNALQDKNKVVRVARFVLANQMITKETLANLFHRLIQVSKNIGGYWDVDGGFEVMAMLGDYFSIEHANYFIKKFNGDWQWLRATKNAMLQLSKTTINPTSRSAILAVVVSLRGSEEFDEFFNQVKENMGAEICNQYLALLIKNEFESPVIPAEFKNFSELEGALNTKNKKCFSLLEFAFSKGIPMICDDASATIQFNNGIRIHVGSNRDYQIIRDYIISLQSNETSPKPDALIKVGLTAAAIPENKLHLMIYQALQDKNKVESVCGFIIKNQLITKSALANLFHRLVQTPQNVGSYWDVDGGFNAMVMLDDQFNMGHANYFINRINNGYWQSLPSAVNAIKKLAENITETTAIHALAKIVTCLRNKDPKLFDEVKDALQSRFKLFLLDDEVHLKLLEQAKTSKTGLFKQSGNMQNVTLTSSSDNTTVPQAGKVAESQNQQLAH